MDRIFTYLVDLPTGINEMVTPCADGYTVYINARCSDAVQRKAYAHALRHVERDDFHSTKPVQQIETEAHGSR